MHQQHGTLLNTGTMSVRIQEHTERVMENAPRILRYLYAVHSDVAIMAKLASEQSKAANLIWSTSLVICAICRALYPEEVFHTPTNVQFYTARARHIFENAEEEITPYQLASLEDMFYASIATLKDFVQEAKTLIDNNFKRPDEPYVHFCAGTTHAITYCTLADFRACARVQYELLLGDSVVQLLREALLNAASDQQSSGLITSPGGPRLSCIDASFASMYSQQFDDPGCWKGKLLHNISNVASGLVFAYLTEKHHALPRDQQSSPHKLSSKMNGLGRRYVSPYNLDERAKRINDPGAPEMPCICDPDCVCAPLCASEPIRNCLCEENALFARVTEGINVDDLAVPDLRRRLSSSETSVSTFNSKEDFHHGEGVSQMRGVDISDISDLVHQQEQEQMKSKLLAFARVHNSGIKSHHDSLRGPHVDSVDLEAPVDHDKGFNGDVPAFDPTWRLPFAHKCDTPPKQARWRPTVKQMLGVDHADGPQKHRRPRFTRALGMTDTLRQEALTELQ